MIVIWSPFAEGEVQKAIDHYEQQRSGLGSGFLGAVRHTVQGISEWPLAGRPVEACFRGRIVSRFPYWLIYTQVGSAIWIASAAHQSRIPGYWRSHWEIQEPATDYWPLVA